MIVIAALYQFRTIESPTQFKEKLYPLMVDLGIKGTLILATEGINGTVAGSREAIDRLKSFLIAEGFNGLEYKESFVEEPKNIFNKTKVKIKSEIVTMGIPNIVPDQQKGVYLSPREWHELIKRPDVIILDTRNDYEFQLGTFKGAINPDIQTFREFPSYLEAHREEWKDKVIAQFCTGGIRCEKSTSFSTLIHIGKEVYHLKGGILEYLKQIPKEESLWEGECYVFDHRVTVDHDLKTGSYTLCYACGESLKPSDLVNSAYEHGVSCPKCVHKTTDQQKTAFRERIRQIQQGDPGTENFTCSLI